MASAGGFWSSLRQLFQLSGQPRRKDQVAERLNVVERMLSDQELAQTAVEQRTDASLAELLAQSAAHSRALVQLHELYQNLISHIKAGVANSPASVLLRLAPDGELAQASGLFDRQWYLERYPDVVERGVDPVVHYLNVGAAEGRDPGPRFSTRWYLTTYPDVAAARLNPLVHYLRNGIAEGRQIHPAGLVTRSDSALEKFANHPVGSKRLSEFPPSVDRLALFLGYETDDSAAHNIVELARQLLARSDHAGNANSESDSAALAHRAKVIAALAKGRQSIDPVLSIVIPVHNQVHHTLACIHSILLYPPALDFEILIGNDLSTDQTEALLGGIGGPIRLISHEGNVGFILNCNRVVSEARGLYVALVNNDTLAVPGSLDALVSTLTLDSEIGIVGSRLVYPDGSLQEAGSFVFDNATAWNYGRDRDPLDPQYNYRRDTDYCSAAAMAIRTKLWRELRGFDESYVPAYYEDNDLAMRVRQAGLRVVYQPRSIFVHFEGKSHGTDGGGLKRYQQINREKFRLRWRKELLSMGACDPDRLPINRFARANVLVVDAEIPRPDSDSGSLDTYEYLRIMVNAGFHVTFMPENLARPEPYTSDLNRIGVETLFHPYWSNLTEVLRSLGPRADAVLLFRLPVAQRTMSLVRQFAPNAKIVFNTVDLHFLRLEREAAFNTIRVSEEDAVQARRSEIDLIKRADASIVVSEYEAGLLAELAPGARVTTIPLPRSPPGDSHSQTFEQRRGILFIGGFRHSPNLDGLMWFVREVWPRLREKGFHHPFTIVGSNMPEDLMYLRNLGIDVRGFVHDIGPVFDGCRLTIAPLRYGAGLKGKIVTSLSYGVPVVATSIAVEGSGLQTQIDVLVADDPERMAAEILQLHEDRVLWERLSNEGLKAFKQRFSVEAASGRLLKLLDELLGTTTASRRGF